MWRRRRKDDGARERRAMEVFLAVCDEPPERRPAALDRACGDDATLRATVEHMLAADARPELPGRPVAHGADDVRLGAYRLVSELGVGAMGAVFLGEVVEATADLPVGHRVAVKLVHPHLLGTPGVLDRFLREARLGQRVRHENVVRTYDCEVEVREGRKQPYLVMEYVEGQTLRDALREMERLPEALCRHVARSVARGLEAVHAAGVVHRDLKPENVLLTKDHAVKVMDLGIARLRDESTRLSVAGQFLGTVEYAAPEQFRDGAADVDGRADLYAVGVMLYELATGSRPFAAPDAPALLRKVFEEAPRRCGERNPQLTPFYEEVVHVLLAKRAAERFGSASELLGVLEQGEASSWWEHRARALRKETRRPLRRVRVPREAALQGRETEGATLRELYERARAGQGQLVFLEGEAGIGKTRLVDELVALLREGGEDLHFLFGAFPPGGAATGYAAFVAAFREHLGEGDLEAALADPLRATPSLVPAFAALLRGETAPAGSESLTKESVHTLFVNATRTLAEERPTVLFVDDLHLAPDEGRGLFAALALAMREQRVLLVGSTHPGASEAWIADLARRAQGTRLRLSRLATRDLLALLTECLGSQRLAEELAPRVALKSDGNPFFVMEIVRSLKASPALRRNGDGGWSARDLGDLEIPSGVLDVVRARLRDLTDEERELLEAASCLGFEFDPGLLAAVLGEPRLAVLRRCGRIEQKRQVLRASGRLYAFDHHLVREAVYQGLHEQMREEMHAAVAEALEREGAASPNGIRGAPALELCEQAFRGARHALGLRHLAAALDHLDASQDDGRTLDLSLRALAAADACDASATTGILLRRASALARAGHADAALSDLLHATRRAEAAGDAARARLARALRGEVLARAGRTAEAEAELQALLGGGASSEEDEGRLRAVLAQGSLDLVRTALREAEARFREARELAGRLGRHADEVQAAIDLGRALVLQARYAEGRRELEAAQARARERGDRRGASRASLNLGLVEAAVGRWEEAASRYEEYLRCEREMGHRLGEVNALANLANVRIYQGRFAEADRFQEPVLRMSREIGHRHAEAIALVNLGGHMVRYGDREGARANLRACLALCRETGLRRVEGYALHRLGHLAEAEGDPVEADASYGRALALRREIGYARGVASTLVALGGLHRTEGRAAEARAELEEARTLSRDQDSPTTGVLATCHLAALRALDVAEAEEELTRDAARIAHEERTAAHLALWEASADPRHLEAAHGLLEFALANAPEERREGMARATSTNRAILHAWASRPA